MRLLHPYLIILFVIFLVAPVGKSYADDPQFFESLYDIPVMTGLSEVKDMSLSFDKAEGRIAYATAIGENINELDILAFYSEALSQMGWHKIAPNTFTREQEKLEISFEKSKASELVKFSIRPIAD